MDGILFSILQVLFRIVDQHPHRYSTRTNCRRIMDQMQNEMQDVREKLALFMQTMEAIAKGQENLQAMVQPLLKSSAAKDIWPRLL